MSKKSKLLNTIVTVITVTLFVAAAAGTAFCGYAAILFIPAGLQILGLAIKTVKNKLTKNRLANQYNY